MARYLTLIFLFIFCGCEMNGEQIVKPQKLSFNDLKFDVVSKSLSNNLLNDSNNHQKIGQIIDYWFNNKIKSNGFDGKLEVIVKKIDINETKKKEYFKFSVELEIELIEMTNDLKINKTYKVKSNEYGEISGSFSIKDQESLSLNIMHQSLHSISKKLFELI